MIWLVYIALILLVIYELYAAITRKCRTISELTWAGLETHPKLVSLVILGIGMLIGHLFL